MHGDLLKSLHAGDVVELNVDMCDNGESCEPTVRGAWMRAELENDAGEFGVDMRGESVGSTEMGVRAAFALAELATLDADPPSSSASSIFICGLPPI